MSNKLREQIIKYKLDKEKAFYISLSDFDNKDVLLDRLAGILYEYGCIIILDGVGISDKDFLEAGEKIKQLCAEFNGALIVCYRADIAYLIEADGVLLDKSSISPEKVHSITGHNTLLGFYSENIFENIDFAVYNKQLSLGLLNKIIKVEEL